MTKVESSYTLLLSAFTASGMLKLVTDVCVHILRQALCKSSSKYGWQEQVWQFTLSLETQHECQLARDLVSQMTLCLASVLRFIAED